MRIHKLILISSLSVSAQFANAAPMLLTVKGVIAGWSSNFAEFLPPIGLGTLMEVTWSYDSDQYINSTVPWTTSTVKINSIPPLESVETDFLSPSAHDDYFQITDADTPTSANPDSFGIHSRASGPGRDFLSWSFIYSDTGNLLNSPDLAQEASFIFSGSDPNAHGFFSESIGGYYATFRYYITSWELDNLEIGEEPVDVPEPSTLAMLGFGILGSGLARRVRKRS